jgi:hypothetical protein
MRMHRLYADEHGEAHFEDVEVRFTESTRAGRLSAREPATGIIFREVLLVEDTRGKRHLSPD